MKNKGQDCGIAGKATIVRHITYSSPTVPPPIQLTADVLGKAGKNAQSLGPLHLHGTSGISPWILHLTTALIQGVRQQIENVSP